MAFLDRKKSFNFQNSGIVNNTRLLNKLFEDETFYIDKESIPYIVRDIINMNYWNTNNFLMGYKNNKRIYGELTHEMKLIAILLKEYYRHNQNSFKNKDLLEEELKNYIMSYDRVNMRQLKLFSMEYRRNDSQYF